MVGLGEFQVTMVYIESSKQGRDTQQGPIIKNNKKIQKNKTG